MREPNGQALIFGKRLQFREHRKALAVQRQVVVQNSFEFVKSRMRAHVQLAWSEGVYHRIGPNITQCASFTSIDC
jgi:hypothetical protein